MRPTLEPQIKMELEVFARNGIYSLKHPQDPATGVGFYMLVAHLTVKRLLVETLNPGFADVVGPRVIDRIDTLELIAIDTADKPQGMGGQLAMGIVANQFGLNFHPGKLMPVHCHAGNFGFVEIVTQGDRLERTPRLPQSALEPFQIFIGNTQNVAQARQCCVHIANALRHYRQAKYRAILRQQNVIPVVHQASGWRYRLYLNPVFVRQCGIYLVLNDL